MEFPDTLLLQKAGNPDLLSVPHCGCSGASRVSFKVDLPSPLDWHGDEKTSWDTNNFNPS